MRQIVLDIETTGLSPMLGHRIVELACVELINHKKTGRRYHHYINPEQEIDARVLEILGLSAEFLAGKPKFSEIAESFVDFVCEAELVFHNAPFDVGFLNSELELAGMPLLDSICSSVCDTLKLARRKHPEMGNSLNALFELYQVDNSHRDFDGALLATDLLAEVYLRMAKD